MKRCAASACEPRAKAGFSLIELLITSSLMCMLLCSVGYLSQRGGSASRQAQSELGVVARAHQLCTRLARELEAAGSGTLTPSPGLVGSSDFSFQVVDGFSAGAPQWGPPSRLAFVLDAAEADNGLDDDGDSLIDEGNLVLTRDALSANPTVVVLCKNVAEYLEGELANGGDDNGNGLSDERGFTVVQNGGLLSLHLTVEQPVQGQAALRSTLKTTIFLRN